MNRLQIIYPDGNTISMPAKVTMWTVNNPSAVKVFGCDLPFPSKYIDQYYGEALLSFHIFRSNFDRVRTVCYGVFTRNKDHKLGHTDAYKDVRELEFAGVARLHPNHPEEFDVMVGIKKSFEKAIDSLSHDERFAYTPNRAYRWLLWYWFEAILELNFRITEEEPFGIWTYNGVPDMDGISNAGVKHLIEDLD